MEAFSQKSSCKQVLFVFCCWAKLKTRNYRKTRRGRLTNGVRTTVFSVHTLEFNHEPIHDLWLLGDVLQRRPSIRKILLLKMFSDHFTDTPGGACSTQRRHEKNVTKSTQEVMSQFPTMWSPPGRTQVYLSDGDDIVGWPGKLTRWHVSSCQNLELTPLFSLCSPLWFPQPEKVLHSRCHVKTEALKHRRRMIQSIWWFCIKLATH